MGVETAAPFNTKEICIGVENLALVLKRPDTPVLPNERDP